MADPLPPGDPTQFREIEKKRPFRPSPVQVQWLLVVGFLSGTYSTIYIATPILIDWMGADEAPVKPGEVKKAATTR